MQVKHEGNDRAAHPLYVGLMEQWEGWTASIQRLSPRMAFLRRADGKVAAIRTPNLSDPLIDRDAVAAVENRYFTECFEVRPVVEEELSNLQLSVSPPMTKRRARVG